MYTPDFTVLCNNHHADIIMSSQAVHYWENLLNLACLMKVNDVLLTNLLTATNHRVGCF